MRDAPHGRRSRTSFQTTAAILAAAEAEFAAHGLDGARMERIAQSAGISKQLIHHYFGSKELLYTHLLNSMAALPDHDRILVDYDEMEPEAALRFLFGGVFDLYRDHPSLARLALDQNIHDAQHVTSRNKTRSQVPELILKLDGILARGARAGVFAADLNAAGVFAAGVSVMLGYFFNRTLFSIAHADGPGHEPLLHAQDAYRAHGLDFVIKAVRPAQAPL